MFKQLKKYAALALMAAVLAAGVVGYLKYRSWQNTIVQLQNELAKRDTTIEVQKQVYARLALQLDDLRSVIDTSTAEGKRLANEIKRNKAELVMVNNNLVKLKEQVASGKGAETDVGGRKKVEFDKDFGFVHVGGFTLTGPPEFQLKLSQGSRPLKLTTALTQLPDGSWKTDVASSDENVAVEIGVTAVNPLIFQPRWYEKIKINADVAAGGQGILIGLGVSYKLGQFDLGPKIWSVSPDFLSPFYGLGVGWAPFEKSR